MCWGSSVFLEKQGQIGTWFFSRAFFALLCPTRFSFLEVWLYLFSSSSFLPLFKVEDDGVGNHLHLHALTVFLFCSMVILLLLLLTHLFQLGLLLVFTAHFSDVFWGPPFWPALEHPAGGERLQPLLPSSPPTSFHSPELSVCFGLVAASTFSC